MSAPDTTWPRTPRSPTPRAPGSQVAGLRKGSNWQDTQWGLFMSRYIFPGADASTPLYWYVQQLEAAGFEVHSVETVGRHYSHTLHAWYDYWMANRKKPELKKYAEMEMPEFNISAKGSLNRLWEIFLAWSVIASGQGSATCYQARYGPGFEQRPRVCDLAVSASSATRHVHVRIITTVCTRHPVYRAAFHVRSISDPFPTHLRPISDPSPPSLEASFLCPCLQPHSCDLTPTRSSRTRIRTPSRATTSAPRRSRSAARRSALRSERRAARDFCTRSVVARAVFLKLEARSEQA